MQEHEQCDAWLGVHDSPMRYPLPRPPMSVFSTMNLGTRVSDRRRSYPVSNSFASRATSPGLRDAMFSASFGSASRS